MFSSLVVREGDGPTYFFDKDLLASGFLVAFTTRNGGSSSPPFNTLNLALHLADAPEKVLDNRAILASTIGLDHRRLTYAEQVHGASVAWVDESAVGAGSLSKQDGVARTDALITGLVNTGLVILTADCLPIAMIDKKRRFAAVVHAGWRGTLDGISAATVRALVDAGSLPGEIEVRFGPAIGECCMEVGTDVFSLFVDRFGLDAADRPRISLSKLNRGILLEAGISDDNIDDLAFCTRCRADLFYSYRRDRLTGRQASIAAVLK